MILFKRTRDLTNYFALQRKKDVTVGFVPTMGALHLGHLSLIDSSNSDNDFTVCSIFINPIQFNNAADLKNYPVTIEEDIEALVSHGCDVLFLPSHDEVYPSDYHTKNYDLGKLETILEGRYRPGHFQGVCQVVDRLLDVVNPNNLYLGQKDYQQCMVINKLMEITGRKDTITLTIVPTMREKDGLAMSSRNLRLSGMQRQLAPMLFETLMVTKNKLFEMTVTELEKQARTLLEANGFKVDYFAIRESSTLSLSLTTNNKIVALVAASIGDIRLIDNLYLN